MSPWLDFYQKKLLCTDQSDMMIRGDYNSQTAQILVIEFNRCHNKTSADSVVCKSEQEINEFIKGKYLTILSNEIRFNSEQPGIASIIKESAMTWYPISYKMQLRYPHQVSMSQLFSQDQPLNLDELTEMANGQIFRLTRQPQMPAETHPWQ